MLYPSARVSAEVFLPRTCLNPKGFRQFNDQFVDVQQLRDNNIGMNYSYFLAALLLYSCDEKNPLTSEKSSRITHDLATMQNKELEITKNAIIPRMIPNGEAIIIRVIGEACESFLTITPQGNGDVMYCSSPQKAIKGQKKLYLEINDQIRAMRRQARSGLGEPGTIGYMRNMGSNANMGIPCGQWSTDGANAIIDWFSTNDGKHTATFNVYLGCSSKKIQRVGQILNKAIVYSYDRTN